MNFSEKIKQIRITNGLTQEQFAEKISVSRQAISKYESGNGYPDVEKLILISKMFHISLDYLLHENSCNLVNDSKDSVNEEVCFIIDIVEKHTGVKKESIIGRSREKDVVEARRIAMFFVRRFTEMPIGAIADVFGGRDHSTIIHGVHTINHLLKESDEYIRKLEPMFWEIHNRVNYRVEDIRLPKCL